HVALTLEDLALTEALNSPTLTPSDRGSLVLSLLKTKTPEKSNPFIKTLLSVGSISKKFKTESFNIASDQRDFCKLFLEDSFATTASRATSREIYDMANNSPYASANDNVNLIEKAHAE